MTSQLRELPHNERPRERLLRWGPRLLSDRELLAVILGTGSRAEDVLSLSGRLLKEAGDLSGLRRQRLPLLLKCPGLGPAKVARIAAALEIVARLDAPSPKDSIPINSPRQAYRAIAAELAYREVEELWVLILNAKNALLEKTMISRGGLNFAAAHPREVFRECILLNGAAIILAHNHPSGDITPSASDERTTAELAKCGRLLGIPVLDHIVLAGGKFVSLKESGAMSA